MSRGIGMSACSAYGGRDSSYGGGNDIMFREMRRKDRLLSADETVAILEKATNGILGLNGDDGYPYTVPVSYAYSDGHIYFHCFKEGYKLDCIKRDPKVSFTVVTGDDIVPEDFGTFFESAICYGKARIISGDEMLESHMHIIRKYSGDYEKEGVDYFKASVPAMVMVDIEIEHVTGKAKKRG